MKKLVVIAVLLLGLGGGGYFGYQHFMGPKVKTAAVEEAPEPLALSYHYVEMPPLNVSVIENGRVRRIYAALVVLEVKDPAHQGLIEGKMPVLQDAFLSYLFKVGSMSRQVDLNNLEIIKRRLQTIANEQLGEPVVNAVLIQSTFERKV